MVSGVPPTSVKSYISLHPGLGLRDPPLWGLETLLPVEESTKFLGLWWDSHLSFKKHISALKTQCKEALNLTRVVAHLKWGGDRDTLDAVPCHCSFQVRPWLHCVWHSIKHQPSTTGQHPLLWTETGIGSILHQPSVLPVHRGQWSSFGGTSVKAVHALLCENLCLHWQSGTSCPAWIRPDH